MRETWRPVVGYEGHYEVSDQGRVRSIDRVTPCVRDGKTYHRRRAGALKAFAVGKGGYWTVHLSNGRTHRTLAVHRLVLEAFVGPRPEGQVTRHLNGNAQDARLCNLTWGTQSDNLYDKGRHGTDHESNKTHCPRGHALVAPNLRPSSLRRGYRECLACANARKRVLHHRKRGVELDFKELADRYHAEILAKTGQPPAA